MRRVKENIGRERPTQVDEIGRIVGFSRGMRGNKKELGGKRPTQGERIGGLVGLLRGIAGDKRRNGRRKTYVEIGNWQVSRSYEENDRKKTRGQEEKGPTQVKETS